MTTIGPIPLNRGWMSDADYFSCPQGGAFTFYGFQPWGNAAVKTMDGYNSFAPPVLPSGTLPLGSVCWQDPAQLGVQPPIFVTPSGAKIYTTLTSTFAAWTDRTGATTPASTIYTFDVLNGKLLLFSSGASYTNVPLVITTYNGNAAVLGGTPPIGNIVKVCNNFAFVGQVLAATGTMSTLYWSAVADPTTWPAASNLTFRNGDGDFITALSAIGTNLFIFKQHSIGILNTSTTILSGTATLGPLTTFNDKIGCVGYTCVDTMPDGSIVFLAMDRHLYQTDGTTIKDLSGLPAPNSNINTAINFPVSGTPPGFYSATGTPQASVKVDPMFHRIIVQFTASSGTTNPIYAYDYFYGVWSDMTEYSNDTASSGIGFVGSLAAMPNQASGLNALGNSVWLGYSNGYLRTFSPYASLSHSSSTQWPCTLETSIQLGGESPPKFTPKCVLIPVIYPLGTTGRIRVFIGFDGTYSSTAAFDSTTNNSLPPLVIVPVKQTVVENSGLRPRTMSIKIQMNGNLTLTQMIVQPIYISDQVLG